MNPPLCHSWIERQNRVGEIRPKFAPILYPEESLRHLHRVGATGRGISHSLRRVFEVGQPGLQRAVVYLATVNVLEGRERRNTNGTL